MADEQYEDEFHIVNENEFEHIFSENELVNNDEQNENDDSDINEDNLIAIPQSNQFEQDIDKKLQDFETQMKQKQKDYELMTILKKELQSKVNEHNKIAEQNQQTFNTFKERLNEYNQLMTTMKSEIQNMQAMRSSLEEEQAKLKSEREQFQNERKEFEKNRIELKEMISKLNKTSEVTTRNEEIFFQNKEVITTLDASQAYCCKQCGTHIALESDVESRCYQIGQGAFSENKRGYLFKNGHNMVLGETKTENFTTGAYSISWVFCIQCHQQIGWKYISADDPQNVTKVGKYCLARYSLRSPQETKDKDKDNKDHNEI